MLTLKSIAIPYMENSRTARRYSLKVTFNTKY